VQHDLVISGIDWHPVTNQIVTCSHDRNAFVWVFDPATMQWKPVVVILRINRAALDVKWSPDGGLACDIVLVTAHVIQSTCAGKKFAVASGNKTAMVCWYESQNNWWISNAVKKAKSSVVAVAWHPSSLVLATASTDYRCRVVSAWVDGLDSGAGGAAPSLPCFSGAGALPELGETLAEFEQTKAWVNDCAWSPGGGQLAWACHDGLLHIASFHPSAAAPPVVQARAVRFCSSNPVLYTHLMLTRCCAADGEDDGPAGHAAAVADGARPRVGRPQHEPRPLCCGSGACPRVWRRRQRSPRRVPVGFCGVRRQARRGRSRAQQLSLRVRPRHLQHQGASPRCGTTPHPVSQPGRYIIAVCLLVQVQQGGTLGASPSDGALWTKHQACITSVQPYESAREYLHPCPCPCPCAQRGPRLLLCAGVGGGVVSFSTSGVDGRVVVWPLNALEHVDVRQLGLAPG
jgi:WD40 repeat protein